MHTPSFVDSVSVSYETMTFTEFQQLPNPQRIAYKRLRNEIQKEIDRRMKESMNAK